MYRFFAPLAAAAAALAATPASAAVLYEFTGSTGSFSYGSADYITVDRYVPATSFDNCTPISGTCSGAAFSVSANSYSVLAFGRNEGFGTTTFYYYFAQGAFAQNGTYSAVLNFNPGTLRVSGFAEPTGAVPEPATWAMLILGFGLVGGALRSARRQGSRVSYA